ncbi:hypothetical protein [Aliivibrio fischeri]|uniref:hypothetical protein n=1 Tax=Aliivibrio fischeri TaxID=668 RepID=UPI00084C99A4|nr:hypothetical protein [Aliivibrio fischeri]OED51247.1 hypothetical protein BEI47_20160 [Aliivibrio fischeri]
MQLNNVVEWSSVAIDEIEVKRRSLMEPLEKSEQELIESINRSFSALLLGNQTVSAHLNSIREVQEVQSDLLEGAGWEGLNHQLNEQLNKLSSESNEGLDKIRKLDKQTSKQLEKLK